MASTLKMDDPDTLKFSVFSERGYVPHGGAVRKENYELQYRSNEISAVSPENTVPLAFVVLLSKLGYIK